MRHSNRVISETLFCLVLSLHLIGVRAQSRSITPQSHWTNANQTRLHYLEWSKRGFPVVLIHGLYDDAHVWQKLATQLAANYRVIAFDRRGSGRSAAPSGGYDHATLASDVQALLESLKLNDVTLIAHSFGGETALTLAAQQPSYLKRLVLVEGGFFPRRAPANDALPVPPCEATPARCVRNVALEQASRAYDAEALYPKVKIPTLLVMGVPVLPQGMDAAPLKEARQHVEQVAQQKLAQGKAVFIERAQHWVQKDQPRALAQAIKAFLAEER
jgi:pimeloyl-ACP methyl ester carboxylesterase